MEQLPIFLNLKGVDVLLLGDGEAAAAKRRLIEAAGGHAVDAPSPTTKIAFVALEDTEAALAAGAKLRAQGLLVNVVDQPAACDFTMPAIVDRAPVTIAVGTAGASASLAKLLRERMEQWMPARLGDLAKAIADARAHVARTHQTPRARRHFWDALLSAGGPLDPLADHQDPQEKIAAALDHAPASARQFDVVLLRSLDPDDLSLRDARLLAQADAIIFEATVPPEIIARARRDSAHYVMGSVDPQSLEGRIVHIEMQK